MLPRRLSLCGIACLLAAAMTCATAPNVPGASAGASAPPTSTADPADWREDLLAAVNAARVRGCRCGGRTMPPAPALAWNAKLEAAARRHVRDMARNSHFDHTGTDGSDSGQRARAAGYQWRAIAENIAWGYEDGAAVVAGWLKSTGHCRNIMDKTYTEMGAAKEEGYWAQVLGRE